MKDYRELIVTAGEASSKLAMARFEAWRAGEGKENHLCHDPACVETAKTMGWVLKTFQVTWEYTVKKAFSFLPETLQTVLINETKLVVGLHLLPQPEPIGGASLMLSLFPEIPPLLQSVFPLERDMPPGLKDVRFVHNATSWMPIPLNLYWMESPDHLFDWFVVAHTEALALEFYSTALRCQNVHGPSWQPVLVGTLTADVSTRCHENTAGWGSMESVWAVGGRVEMPTFPRVVTINGKTYTEGKQVMTANLKSMIQEVMGSIHSGQDPMIVPTVVAAKKDAPN